MYNFCFRYHNLDYCYMAFDIKEDQVPAALDAMRLFNMRGCNVTMPCKNKVAQCVDELSPAAKIIGAVNTIVNEDGKLEAVPDNHNNTNNKFSVEEMTDPMNQFEFTLYILNQYYVLLRRGIDGIRLGFWDGNDSFRKYMEDTLDIGA